MTAMPDWCLAFAGAVTAALPANLDEETARAWTADPDGLRAALAGALGGSAGAAESGPIAFVNDKAEDGWTLVKDAPDAPMIAAARRSRRLGTRRRMSCSRPRSSSSASPMGFR